ncbi:peptidylprolyl isomerase [Microbulbifer sp. 2201CG32-9]|uniref:peptidylprolyl isomerase n=1 Tax=Microbulbifer sp. 2201CG32-9 TaxID=3232309 RepID=UPI00345BF87A
MNIRSPLALCALLPFAFASAADSEVRAPAQIIAEAPDDHWRPADLDNTLYLDTVEGRVIIELSPIFAPAHTRNIKALAREGFYDGLAVYRVAEGFVAQGGDQSGEKPIEGAKRSLAAELTLAELSPEAFTPVAGPDGYAPQTGFVQGFPAARDPDTDEAWLAHCQGAFAMARGAELNSGGTEFYIVIGQAQRYLDRNTTVFGRVLEGMTTLQKLSRGEGPMGMLPQPERNRIERVRVAADLPEKERAPLQVMKTDSDSFRELIAARRHRPEDWFVYRPDYADVCAVGIPLRAAPELSAQVSDK